MRYLVTAFLLCLVVASTHAAELSLETLMSTPFPTSLVASPSGEKFAWVQKKEGVRNMWIAEPPAYAGRQLTAYTADDGQDVGSLTWTPDGSAIFYVRGGSANRDGDVPNPTSDPNGAEQAIWKVSAAAGSQIARIGEGNGPAVSPRGDVLLFLRKGAVYSAPVDGSKEPTQLFKMRGTAGSLRWSPDASKVAFVSNRRTHAFVGVYDFATKSLRFLAPSVDRDGEPAWSPDSSRVAFVRIPASTKIYSFRGRRSGEPWSIVVANATSGNAKTIFRAEKGAGSLMWEVVAPNQLMWGADDRIVFPWEKSGWVNLYTVSAHGGAPTPLATGNFEVEYVTMSRDGREVLYNSNQDDIDRRHLWRVSLHGAKPAAITKGDGTEWAPALASDGNTIAYFRSSGKSPAHAVVRMKSGETRPLDPKAIPPDFPMKQVIEPRQVIFNAADGMPIHGQLFVPANGDGKHPAVIYFHGGSRRQMTLGWNYRGYYHNADAFNRFLASRGYVVLSVNYRSGIGYGLDFREAINYGAGGASEFNDVLGAGLYLRGRPDVDPKRIGLWGGSYGGFLTALGLARASDLFAAGVDIHGVHDWNIGIQNFVPNYNPLELTEQAHRAFESSPMFSVDTWRSPVLVIHGDDDRNVQFRETINLVEALRERGVEVEQLIFPDEVHDFLLHAHWVEAYRAAAGFFDRKLKGGSSESR